MFVLSRPGVSIRYSIRKGKKDPAKVKTCDLMIRVFLLFKADFTLFSDKPGSFFLAVFAMRTGVPRKQGKNRVLDRGPALTGGFSKTYSGTRSPVPVTRKRPESASTLLFFGLAGVVSSD